MSGSRSESVNGVRLSTYAGMRVEETTCLKVGRIHFSGGEFGLEYIEIVKGAEGGAKGGRLRTIPILDKEAQNALKIAVAGKKPKDFIVVTAKGEQMGVDTVSAALCKTLKREYDDDTYKYNGCHAMRKAWVQRYYDAVREKCDKKRAIGKTNVVLGHGYNRDASGFKTYVKNMW